MSPTTPSPRSGPRRPGAWRLASAVTLLATITAAVAAAPAVAAPSAPVAPADEAVTTTLRPTFEWTAGSSGAPIVRYEVFVELPAGPVEVLETVPPALSGTSTIDLPDDTRLRWFVRVTNSLGGVASTPVEERTEVVVATPPAAPALTGGPPSLGRVSTASFSWTGARTGSRWALLDEAGTPSLTGDAPAGGGAVTLGPIADGLWTFRVAQLNAAGAAGEPAVRSFRLDATPPAAPTVVVGGSRRRPVFTWRGVEAGATFAWQVRGPRGAIVAGPTTTAATSVRPARLRPGVYAFEVRASDAAGNTGEAGTRPFPISEIVPILQGLGPESPMRQVRSRAARLTPRAGARLARARPVLRWKRAGVDAELYNVQVFRLVSGRSLVKVASVFPRSNRAALPKGLRLAHGACYVWRVWPYRRSGYAPSALGVSDFCVRPRP